jgi:hypothetical protein
VIDLVRETFSGSFASLEVPICGPEKFTTSGGMKLMLLTRTSEQLRAHLFPRNRLDFAAVNLANPPLDFFGPRGFYIRLGGPFEALQESARQLGSIVLGEFGGLTKEFLQRSSHSSDSTNHSMQLASAQRLVLHLQAATPRRRRRAADVPPRRYEVP